MSRLLPIAPVLALLAIAAGCRTATPPAAAGPAPADTAFHALQERGRQTMGVDQYTSTHRFDALPDGGRIELQRDGDDPAGVETIRAHLQQAAAAFAAGDFAMPAFVHMREMPGVADMARLRDRITYAYTPLPRGGQVRITTTDPEAVRAVHAFMAAQRMDHHSGGAGHGDGHAE
jgi:hypothetical protein